MIIARVVMAPIIVGGLVMLGFGAGCRQAPRSARGAASSAEIRARSAPKAPSARSHGAPERRRGRAGIETGEAAPPRATIARPTRPPAAVLIRPPGVSSAPPLLSGPDARAARAARRFLETRWIPAVRGGAAARYAKLLTDPFNASRTEGTTTKAYDAQTWPAAQHAGLGAPLSVMITPPRISLAHDASGTTPTIRFTERAVGSKGCRMADHELTLTPGAGAPRLRTEIVSARRPCGAPVDTSGVAKTIAAIAVVARAAREDRDVGALAHDVAERVDIRDGGVRVASYSAKELALGDGRWVLHLIAGGNGTRETPFILGSRAVVPARGPVRLLFGEDGGRWKLRAILREVAASSPASPKAR